MAAAPNIDASRRRPPLAVALAATLAASACASDAPSPPLASTAVAGATAPSAIAVAAAPLSELEARALLGDGLRAAGFRIRNDVALATPAGAVVLDGWDTDRAIGFEYVASAEGDPQVPDAARPALGPGVLVVAEGDEAAVRGALERFVAGLGAVAPAQ